MVRGTQDPDSIGGIAHIIESWVVLDPEPEHTSPHYPDQVARLAADLPMYSIEKTINAAAGRGERVMFQANFNDSYNRYLILRGYEPSWGKPAILRRALLESWGEPGFHRFWRVWNPGIGHLLYRLYLVLGGNRVRLLTTMLVFIMCGLIHDFIVMLIFRRPFIAFTATFFFSGVLSALNRSIEPILGQDRWPRLLNATCNASCLGISIYCAVQLQMFVFP